MKISSHSYRKHQLERLIVSISYKLELYVIYVNIFISYLLSNESDLFLLLEERER